MSQTNKQISISTYFLYVFLSITLLTTVLFKPEFFQNLGTTLSWQPTPRPTPESAPQQAVVKTSSIGDTTNQTCYSWNDLSKDQLAGVQSLLDGNPLASKTVVSENPGKYNISVITPANDGKKQILSQKLNSMSIQTADVITLGNGNKAWFVGSSKDITMAQNIKKDMETKGAWNVQIDPTPSSYSVNFNTSSQEFISKLSTFGQERGMSSIANCSK